MRHRFLLGIAVGVAALVAGAQAQAQNGPGSFYIGGEGGWTSLENQKATAVGLSGTVHADDGFNVGGRAGYMWGPWRFEEEVNYRRNGLSSLSAGGLSTPMSGHLSSTAIMTNVLYDFSLNSPFSPHLGAGIGAVNIDASGSIPAGGVSVTGSDWEFGYQAIAGVRYNINPSLAFDLDYRYFATTDATLKASGAGLSTPIKTGYSTHNLVASLSFIFGAPPPPPPVVAPAAAPAPPPAARKVFLVFFDWDRDTITTEGMAIIQAAANAFKAGTPVKIMVTGYTDRSGSPGYNQRLSERRANNVAKALVKLGVPREDMTVSGRGENDNRVPTADGVREPQNRRVEIVFP